MFDQLGGLGHPLYTPAVALDQRWTELVCSDLASRLAAGLLGLLTTELEVATADSVACVL